MSVAGTELFDEHEHHEQQSVVGGPSRIVVTQEGILDPSLLIRTEGYMYKKGGAVNARGGFRNWKRRYFVLVPVDFFGYQGYELQYYDVPNGTLKGTVALNDVDIFVDSRSENKKVKFEFQLILQNGGELQLSCDSEEEREEWVRTLQVIIDFLQKVATQPAMMLDGYDPMMEDDEETYHIGEELAQNCQAFGPGLFGSEAGKSTQFVVNIHDLTGQRVMKGGMPMVATITNEDSIYYLAMVDNDDGSFYCNYVLGKAGKYQLSITLNEEHHIFGSPFDIEILPSKTVPRFCQAEGEILEKMAIKSTGTFVIHAMDGFGNHKTRGGDPFEVSIMGPGQVIDLEDRNDGSYVCTITTTNASSQSQSIFTSSAIMIMVSLYGKAIQGSPFKPVMLDGMRTQSFLAQATNNNNATTTTNAPSNNSTNKPSSKLSEASPMATQGNNISGNNSVRTTASHTSSVKPPPQATQTTPKAAANVNINTNSSVRAPPAPPLPPASSSASVASQPLSSVANTSLPQTPMAATQPLTASQLQTPVVSHQPVAASPSPSPATAANIAGQGLSRLERSRQRALLAKSLAEQNASGNNIPVAAHANTPQRPAPMASSSPASAMNNINNNINNNNNNNPTSFSSSQPTNNSHASTAVAGGRLAQLAARSKMTLETLKNNQNNTSNPTLNPTLPASSSAAPPSSLQRSSAGSPHQESVRSLLTGLVTDTPPEQVASTQMEHRVWQQVHQALTHPASSRTVLDHIVPHLDTLQQVYSCFADRVPSPNNDAEMVLRLATARGYGGLLKMLEMYEVIPHFLNRLEAKTLFNLAMASQKLLRSPVQNGLDFPAFVKFLLFVANCALNKAQAFADQYATPESRVDFILIKLGLGDSSRFQNVRRALLNANATDI